MSSLLRQQFIRTGETRGDFVAVTEGLKAGQEVVSTGVFKLRNGMNVVVDNKLAPKAELNPTPERYLTISSVKTFTDLFIRRPVLALVVSLVIIIAGLQAMSSLNVRQYPRSDNASVTVTRFTSGASAELVRGFITTPLERAIAAADGIDYLAIAQLAGRLDDHRAPEAQLRLEQGALRNQFQGQPGAERSAARSRSAGDQHRVGRLAVRFRLSQLHLQHSAGERDHRLPRSASSSRG